MSPYAPVESKNQRAHTQAGVIVAKLSGCDTASAEGMTVTGSSPALNLCRELIERGYDPALPLVALRGETICLKIRSIGEADWLRVGSHGVGFEVDPECGAGPPIAPPALPRTQTPGRARRASDVSARS